VGTLEREHGVVRAAIGHGSCGRDGERPDEGRRLGVRRTQASRYLAAAPRVPYAAPWRHLTVADRTTAADRRAGRGGFGATAGATARWYRGGRTRAPDPQSPERGARGPDPAPSDRVLGRYPGLRSAARARRENTSTRAAPDEGRQRPHSYPSSRPHRELAAGPRPATGGGTV